MWRIRLNAASDALCRSVIALIGADISDEEVQAHIGAGYRALDRRNRSRIAEDRISDAGIALCMPSTG